MMATSTTRCKFRTGFVGPMNSSQDGTVLAVLTPVYSSDPNSENRKFWDATPQGELRLVITNQDAAQILQPNTEYYIDISKATPVHGGSGI